MSQSYRLREAIDTCCRGQGCGHDTEWIWRFGLMFEEDPHSEAEDETDGAEDVQKVIVMASASQAVSSSRDKPVLSEDRLDTILGWHAARGSQKE